MSEEDQMAEAKRPNRANSSSFGAGKRQLDAVLLVHRRQLPKKRQVGAKSEEPIKDNDERYSKTLIELFILPRNCKTY